MLSTCLRKFSESTDWRKFNSYKFFITVAPTTWLDRKHSIFGEVKNEASQKIVQAISEVKVGGADRPVQAVKITSVSLA